MSGRLLMLSCIWVAGCVAPVADRHAANGDAVTSGDAILRGLNHASAVMDGAHTSLREAQQHEPGSRRFRAAIELACRDFGAAVDTLHDVQDMMVGWTRGEHGRLADAIREALPMYSMGVGGCRAAVRALRKRDFDAAWVEMAGAGVAFREGARILQNAAP